MIFTPEEKEAVKKRVEQMLKDWSNNPRINFTYDPVSDRFIIDGIVNDILSDTQNPTT